ncbi:hypothetical protein VM1G_00916 [Cytospora mali]|uniref:Uncharacterized protein n=1 Tax=Cytospora mali TaxID=578113 RepID=A0A194VNA7_CYTMA|nr:hypothetical protein VM1G_00916 [Valsa mali]
MNGSATPTKRRVLGALDVNVQMSPRSPKVFGSPLKKGSSRETTAGLSRHATPSPRKAISKEVTPKKRPLGEEASVHPIAKKLCSETTTKTEVDFPSVNVEAVEKHATVQDADEDEPAAPQPAGGRRSISPDASSLFDTSVMNTSQDTTITEPDTDAPITTTTTTVTAPVSTPASILDTLTSLPPPPPPPRRVPTREEFRQKAEILRLRLSLATYKVKTGQADVPLEKLQVRPVPGMTTRRTPLPSMSAHTIQRSTPAQQWYRSRAPPGRDGTAAAAAAAEGEGEEVVEGEGEGEGESESHEGAGKSAGSLLPEKNALPKLPAPSLVSTPRKRRTEEEEEEEEISLTSSALRGGAAKGLLSLSHGSI